MSHGRSPMEGDRLRESGLTFQASPKSPGAHGAACANPVGAITSLTSTTDGTIRSIAPALNEPAAARSCAGRIPEPTGSVHLQEPVDKPELVARRGIFPQGKAQQGRRSRPSTAAQRSLLDKGRRPQGIPAPHNVAAALQNHHHTLIRCHSGFSTGSKPAPTPCQPISLPFLRVTTHPTPPSLPPPAHLPRPHRLLNLSPPTRLESTTQPIAMTARNLAALGVIGFTICSVIRMLRQSEPRHHFVMA